MEYVLGIDVGSSSVKAGVFTLAGSLAAMFTRAYTAREPHPGWKEQDAEIWWNAVADALRQIAVEIDTRQIRAIGCAGHICSHTFVNRLGRPLRASLGFQDQRAAAEVAVLNARFSRRELAAELGIDLPPAATWPLPRLMWLQANDPEVLEQAHYVLQPKDFINFQLTGEFASDASSNRGLVSLATGRPPSSILSRLGLPERLLPVIYPPERVIGRVSGVAAAATGLAPGTPVVAGWNDLNASVLGSGTVGHGAAFDVTGSSEHAGVVTATDRRAPELMCAPFLPGKSLFYGVTSNGGSALAWCCDLFEIDITDASDIAAGAPAGAGGLFFLPYLDGERAPIWDPCAAGAFVGIRTHHTRAHFLRAVLEGVAFSLAQILEAVEREAGVRAPAIVISGGAARVRLWNNIKANVWGRPAIVAEHVHTGALGAAMLAAAGVGRFSSCVAAAEEMVRSSEAHEVVPELTDPYRQTYLEFCGLYPSLQKHFNQAARWKVEAKESLCPVKPR
ncbi:MAG: xylulokinase [Terriglobia bacterium]